MTGRRNFVLSAAAFGAALGLDSRLAIAEPAQTQRTPDPCDGFFRYRVGSVECTAVYDGIWEKPHDPGYFENASIEETKNALVAAGLPADFVSIPITALVLNLNGKLVLCDAGAGGQVQPLERNYTIISGKLIANMTAAGINPAKIETILISHFHPDHIYGLMAKDNAPIFPDAEIIVPAYEYKWWTDPSVINRLPPGRRPLAQRIQAVFPTWKNIRQVAGEPEVLPGVRFVSAPGHTPGHTAFHLSSGKEQMMISNDTAYVPALNAAHPDWHGAFDQDKPLASISRRKLLDRVIADKMMICGYHFPWPAVGTIAKDGTGFALSLPKA